MQARESMSRQPRTQAAHATQIPMRTADLCHRGRRLVEGHWDVNAALLLAEDAETLASTCHLLVDPGTARRLEDLAECLWARLDPPRMPDDEDRAAISAQLDVLDGPVAEDMSGTDHEVRTTLFGYATVEDNGFPLLVRPPPEYWLRLAPDAARRPTTVAAPAPVPAPVTTPVPAPPPAEPALIAAPPPPPAAPEIAPEPEPAPEEAPEQTSVEAVAASAQRRACHLSDGSLLSADIDLQLRALGYALELPGNLTELKDLLSRSAPALVILDGAHQDALESIGALVKAARTRSNQRISLVALAGGKPDLAARLRAMRAGCDAFIVQPANAEEVLGRIREL